MKIKNSSQVVNNTATTTTTTSANLVPVSFTSSAITNLNAINLSETTNLDDEHSTSPNQILTRSAAVRAQLTKSLKPNEPHRRHNHHHQHVIGKIVKPIPVRPVSSSSSSSSTHSSHHHHHHHHAHHHRNTKTNEHLLANLYEMSSATLPAPPPQPNENFSLIAKYFASFPATRLKTNASPPSSSPVFEQQQTHNELFKSLNKPNISSNKSTPFLPFKKTSTTSASSTASLAAVPAPILTGFTSNFSSQPVDSQTSGLNLRSHAHGHSHGFANLLLPVSAPLPLNQPNTTTDYLCTNFKRMIKLNDYAEETSAASPQTATSNTPTGILDSDETNESTNSSTGAVVDYASASSSGGAPRFGQITMETRLTRKFLIKHHPYLQINSVTGQQQQQQTRPSINLIKMKKLICASSKEAECSNDNDHTPKAGTSPVLFNASSNKSGRTSRLAEDKLVKFTDKFSAEPNLSPLGPAKRRQSVLSKQQPSSNSKSKNSNSEWSYLDYMYGKDEADLVDDEEIDDSQEDSSGYYSSYHSVDLISSSGGSSGGDLLISRQSKLNSLITGANKPNDAKSQQQQQQIPHHHYHTRYLSNYLQQNGTSVESNSPSGSASRNRSATPNSKQASLVNNTPTTRLRYQQQLAAAAAAKTSVVKQHHHHNHSQQQHDLGYVECDLDLDQIEND